MILFTLSCATDTNEVLSGLVISKLAHHTVEGGTSCDWALQHNKVLIYPPLKRSGSLVKALFIGA